MGERKKGEASTFLEFAEELVKEAGKLALKYYGQGNPEVKFDDALVTEADWVIRDFISTSISRQYPEHRLLGEGTTQTTYRHGSKGFQWIVDPVDGTANFQAGIPIWGISLALYENFWPILGLFHMPVTGDVYKALAGRTLMVNDTPLTSRPEIVASNESVLLTYSRFHNEFRSSFPGKIRNLGSTAAHLSYVASARAEAALLKYVHIWDLAAGQILLEAVGGEIRYLDGKTFHLNDFLDGQKVAEPLLAAPSGEHGLITQYLELS
ncbi:MAG: inositol monophosphatase [Deltaproteobacteria bacterium]|nr:inositol monophosphatase [Deltaproteobacteria bacterium]MBW2070230.1 inositol monophosphatase [Deltaproteobacteria bacterium]